MGYGPRQRRASVAPTFCMRRSTTPIHPDPPEQPSMTTTKGIPAMIEVSDQAHLEALPDGTIIRWLRIPGDPTSEAVAFVRVEIEQETWQNAGGEQLGETRRTVWISPGGWEPMTVEEAGIIYPAEVVMLPPKPDDVPPDVFKYLHGHWPEGDSELITGLETQTLMSGGTYPRDKALEFATQWTLSDTNSPDNVPQVIAIASAFEKWLIRDDETDPAEPNPQNEYQRLHALANEIDWAGLCFPSLKSRDVNELATNIRYVASSLVVQ